MQAQLPVTLSYDFIYMTTRFTSMQSYELPFSSTLQIGSSVNFEDQEFESVKFLHPPSAFYHAAKGCLFIVDSEVLSLVDCFLMLFFFTVQISMIFSDPIMICLYFLGWALLLIQGQHFLNPIENTFQVQFIILVSYPLHLPFLHVILGMTMISARHNTDHVP